jgi:hypothetical protein
MGSLYIFNKCSVAYQQSWQLNHELAHPDGKIRYITIPLDRHLVLPSTISYLSLCDPYLKEQYTAYFFPSSAKLVLTWFQEKEMCVSPPCMFLVLMRRLRGWIVAGKAFARTTTTAWISINPTLLRTAQAN